MNIIRYISFGLAFFLCIMAGGCARDYSGDIPGTWDAGMAAPGSGIRVVLGGDGSITASVSNLDIKPITGRYAVHKNRMSITFPRLKLDYLIQSCDGRTLVMTAGDIRVTWKKIK